MIVNKFIRLHKLPLTTGQRFLTVQATVTPENWKTTGDSTSTVNPKDVEHHKNQAAKWWDTNGPMAPLHALNAIRVPFIRDGIISTTKVASENLKTIRVLQGYELLEVGCGGGFLTENLARLHANVTAIDPGAEVIEAAKEHVCLHSPDLVDRINYLSDTIENFSKTNADRFDAVIMSEVVEHVENVPQFIAACVATVKPGGSIFITTPNRTIPMLIGGILLAENVFSLVPRGTHQWNRFVEPVEMQRILDSLNCTTILVNGYFYEMWRNTWRWVPWNTFCYAVQAIKRTD